MRTDAQAYKSLAQAVLAKALQDAVAPTNGTRQGIAAARPYESEKAEARAFCLDAEGEWAESREWWCDVADECPRRFMATARRMIAKAEGWGAWHG